MADIPADAPEHCPGTASDTAGKAAACQGCPNQNVCSVLPKGPDPAVAEIKERLSCVKHKIVVLSGKGGVGKSTFTAHLAHGLATDHTKQVGVLDVDICGPSIPRILGVEGEQVHQSGSGWSPVYVDDNLSVMSIGFLLGSPDDAVIWRGPKKNGRLPKKPMINDSLMLARVRQASSWSRGSNQAVPEGCGLGEMDFLVIDTPPGTSDEHLSVAQYLKESQIDGAVIITTPQELSLLDVRKEVNFCRKVEMPIIGVVENMSGFVCPKCKNESQIFPPTTGGGEQMAADMDVKFLGKLPLDPRIGKCCDEGKSFLTEVPDSPASQAYTQIINKIVDHCNKFAASKEIETGEQMEVSSSS